MQFEMSNILEINNISKSFGNFKALNNVSLSVPKGSIVGLLGPNGAGKTTLIRIVNQIFNADEGEVLFDGEKISPKHIENIGYLPEERGLYKKMKVGEQALYLAQLKGLSEKEARERLKFWFEKFEIKPWWNKKVEELSKGMQQKVQFITTILHKPELLIFDEPFSGFDPINVNLLKEEILKLREDGASIIFSTHNMASVEELCDHFVLLNKSNLILDGGVKEIKDQYKSNTFILEYNEIKKPLNGLQNYQLQNHDKEAKLIQIQNLNNLTSNEVLKDLMPYMSIISFREKIPTMNEIFIQKVQENK